VLSGEAATKAQLGRGVCCLRLAGRWTRGDCQYLLRRTRESGQYRARSSRPESRCRVADGLCRAPLTRFVDVVLRRPDSRSSAHTRKPHTVGAIHVPSGGRRWPTATWNGRKPGRLDGGSSHAPNRRRRIEYATGRYRGKLVTRLQYGVPLRVVGQAGPGMTKKLGRLVAVALDRCRRLVTDIGTLSRTKVGSLCRPDCGAKARLLVASTVVSR